MSWTTLLESSDSSPTADLGMISVSFCQGEGQAGHTGTLGATGPRVQGS